MTATRPSSADDDHLRASWREFDDAVAALTGPRHQIRVDDDGNRLVCTAGSLYDEMQDNLAGQQGTAFGGVARSMPPLWVDGVDWLRRVDDTVTIWAPGATGTTHDKLTYLLGWSWMPADFLWLRTAATEIQSWVVDAEDLIAGRGRFSVSAACPACGESEIVRVVDDEHVRTPVLQVSMKGASCLACHHEWGIEYALALARTLGCDPLDGIDPGVAGIVR
ncbi:hypothetical protein FNU77_08580 [Prescottella equi]|uniref:DUF7341 domain-containing protein n=1 Tax=Rhodococcus hoagii TaxID=43767 RepID=UPI001163EFA9|nr:hypothetical protein [Prescottella equi]QDP09767.1 hypothetical protein FNU77_08580 [Prescottella equi]